MELPAPVRHIAEQKLSFGWSHNHNFLGLFPPVLSAKVSLLGSSHIAEASTRGFFSSMETRQLAPSPLSPTYIRIPV